MDGGSFHLEGGRNGKTSGCLIGNPAELSGASQSGAPGYEEIEGMRRKLSNSGKYFLLVVAIFVLAATSTPVTAAHVPVALDVAALWMPAPGAGYLNFVEPGPVPGIPPSGTEEYTGWVDNVAGPFGTTGAKLDATGVGPVGPAVDNGLTHGDHADFDFVVENRPIETAAIAPPVGLGPLHPGVTGFLTWEIAPTAPSAHIDPATGLPHPPPHGPLTLALPDYAAPEIGGVDVFSIIADPTGPAAVVTDPFVAVLECQAALDLVRHDGRFQHVEHPQRFFALGARLSRQVVGDGEDAAQVIRRVAPLGSEPRVVEVEPADHAADIERAVDRVEMPAGSGDPAAVRHLRPGHPCDRVRSWLDDGGGGR